MKDYILEFEVRVESTLRDLRKRLTEAIRDKDCYKEILDATMEDYDEMGRTYEAKLATLRVKLTHRGQIPSAIRIVARRSLMPLLKTMMRWEGHTRLSSRTSSRAPAEVLNPFSHKG